MRRPKADTVASGLAAGFAGLANAGLGGGVGGGLGGGLVAPHSAAGPSPGLDQGRHGHSAGGSEDEEEFSTDLSGYLDLSLRVDDFNPWEGPDGAGARRDGSLASRSEDEQLRAQVRPLDLSFWRALVTFNPPQLKPSDDVGFQYPLND